MKIRLHNSSVVCNAGPEETILLACARGGIILPAPCGGRQRCGKCKVQLLEGTVAGDTPDDKGWVRSCIAVPVSDITIAAPLGGELGDNEVTALELPAEKQHGSGRPGPLRAGIALDIGTTTVSARLMDLDTSRALDTISELNDQRAFGADVMSRIGAAKNGKTGELFSLINRQTERIITTFKKRWNSSSIEKLSVSGNTVMLHLFLNTDPSGMGELPFTPVFLEEKEIKGAALSLSTETVSVLPSIAAFIGADITAGMAVLDMLNTSGPSLLIDIGTNGEMALCSKGTIYCCSTAAGPAFEGAEISCGLGGVKGAISGVEAASPGSGGAEPSPGTPEKPGTNAVSVTTIGNVPPIGICGSGLIDAVAVMLKLGIIDETGSMTGAEKSFYLAPGVSIIDRDIRQFQLAKSAILSGIKILCKNAGLKTGEIQNVFIAGGFGFFINKRNAVAAGLFPEEFLSSIIISGNLSLQGAEEFLSAKDFMARCKKIIARCRVIDLAADPSFMDEFAENMLFQI
ncbi:MAG: ASKHA domain-containing protein [Treponema sp.]|nr:ASKHA domain-containing protein [Treponema sp.]